LPTARSSSHSCTLSLHDALPIFSKDQIPNDETIEEDIFKEYRMQGLLKADGNVVQMMDHSLTPGKTSKIVPAGIKKDGNFRKNRSEEHTSELQSRFDIVCRLLRE